MKIIAFCGAPNTGKTTMISELEKILSRNGYAVKVYDEIASNIFGLMPNRYNKFKDHTEYQEALYHLECARLLELEKDKKSNKYDYILIDRTWYDQQLFYEWLLGNSKCSYIYMSDYEIDLHIYNYVVLFKNPITMDSPFYANDNFITFFNSRITARYGPLVKEYSNAISFLNEGGYRDVLSKKDKQ